MEDQATARLEADLDGDGIMQAKLITLAKLLNITVRALRDTSAAITWNTSDSAYSRVEYGLTPAYGQTAAGETAVKDLRMYHEIVLSGLTPNTTYHFRISSRDTYGSSRSSEDNTFTTLSTSALEDFIKAARSQGDLPKTYYVKEDGSDSADGLSRENAWQSPAYAAQQAEAGDTVYLIAGTWSDEHLDFSHSGLEAAPIILTTCDGGMSVLDGLDKTGFGIRLRGKSHVRISRVQVKNYSNAMYFQDELSDIKISDFIVENTQRAGITFSGSGPISRITFSQFETYETGIDGGDTALSYGGGSNFTDIEIYDFNIHDT